MIQVGRQPEAEGFLEDVAAPLIDKPFGAGEASSGEVTDNIVAGLVV